MISDLQNMIDDVDQIWMKFRLMVMFCILAESFKNRMQKIDLFQLCTNIAL